MRLAILALLATSIFPMVSRADSKPLTKAQLAQLVSLSPKPEDYLLLQQMRGANDLRDHAELEAALKPFINPNVSDHFNEAVYISDSSKYDTYGIIAIAPEKISAALKAIESVKDVQGARLVDVIRLNGKAFPSRGLSDVFAIGKPLSTLYDRLAAMDALSVQPENLNADQKQLFENNVYMLTSLVLAAGQGLKKASEVAARRRVLHTFPDKTNIPEITKPLLQTLPYVAAAHYSRRTVGSGELLVDALTRSKIASHSELLAVLDGGGRSVLDNMAAHVSQAVAHANLNRRRQLFDR